MSAVSDLFAGVVERIDMVSLPPSARRSLEMLANPEMTWYRMPSLRSLTRAGVELPVTRAEIEAAFVLDGVPLT